MKQTILTFLLASLCLMAVAQSDNMLSTPLTIEAISDGVVTIDNPRSLTKLLRKEFHTYNFKPTKKMIATMVSNS